MSIVNVVLAILMAVFAFIITRMTGAIHAQEKMILDLYPKLFKLIYITKAEIEFKELSSFLFIWNTLKKN